jgi:ribosomal protein L30/L7E
MSSSPSKRVLAAATGLFRMHYCTIIKKLPSVKGMKRVLMAAAEGI